jgi:hypothetical protein
MPVTSYSTTPASNNSAAPNGAPEGWAPSAVNDTIRQIMTDIAVEAQKNAVKVLASVAGTDTITGSMTPALTAYSAGMLVVLTPANTNTGAATLNIDTLGALDVFRFSGEALHAGDLVAGVPAFLVLDSGADDFYLLNPQNVGFRNIPQFASANSHTFVLSDAGKHFYTSATAVYTVTIPANASVAYPIGTVLSIINRSANNMTIAITSDTLILAGTSSTGSRTLADNGIATAIKFSATGWLISGSGLS